MSVYRQQATEMNDVDCLKKALEKVPSRGKKHFEPQVHAEAVPLEGYEGRKRTEKAEIVLPRNQVGSSSNDIGFARDEKGNFRAIISEFDSHFYNKGWLNQVKVEYTKEKAIKIARSAGFRQIKEHTLPNGKLRMQFVQQ